MWDALREHFRRYPAQDRVVRTLITHGLQVREGKIRVGEIEVADTAVARACNVDRRIVRATVQAIEANDRLYEAFQRFQSTLHLRDVAPKLGCGVIEITPDRADRPGILAGVSQAISSRGISIRQAIVDDPEFVDAPRLFVVTEKPPSPNIIPTLRNVPGVRSVTLY